MGVCEELEHEQGSDEMVTPSKCRWRPTTAESLTATATSIGLNLSVLGGGGAFDIGQYTRAWPAVAVLD